MKKTLLILTLFLASTLFTGCVTPGDLNQSEFDTETKIAESHRTVKTELRVRWLLQRNRIPVLNVSLYEDGPYSWQGFLVYRAQEGIMRVVVIVQENPATGQLTIRPEGKATKAPNWGHNSH